MTRPAAKRLTLSDQLRGLIADRDLSGYALAELAGLNRSVVNRFLGGEGLTLSSLDALAGALGLRLVETGRSSRAVRGGRPGRVEKARRKDHTEERDRQDDEDERLGEGPSGAANRLDQHAQN